MFGRKKAAIAQLQQENALLRQEMQRLGAMDVFQVQQERAAVTQQVQEQRARFESERAALAAQQAVQQKQFDALSAAIVQTNDALLLQEVGVYAYRHVLADAEAYKRELEDIKQRMTSMVKQKTAVRGSESFHYNNSLAKGRKFVGDLSKLMLRAYNAEAENCVRILRAGNLASAIKRLETSVRIIEKLGVMAAIQISPGYHALRIRELELTADYLAKKQEEREAQREERARLREEQKAMEDYRREQARLLKEKTHYQNAIAALRAKGDLRGLAELEVKLAEIEAALRGVEERQANIRAGYVYVISNLGAFGDQVVKIGMTRRLEPMDRVRELGDASVPFRFDVHALFFSQDAVSLENELHRKLADRRLNKVNLRREFFRTTPAEVKALLHQLAGNLLDYTDEAEAPEYRQSIAKTGPAQHLPSSAASA
ncbi:DUF4041 domain-containing protein [Allokutzneria sp. NRRL B-24872]|uniref:DUF4041 domain-containing protein n=1 Tax=Allokutzneria sp. NRRL B-24872 TaxID=1137961 RepID=UPI000A3B6821|nr:DUF4041 domain-containing protein [Allokutzneria sp. NRRL B-24872]